MSKKIFKLQMSSGSNKDSNPYKILSSMIVGHVSYQPKEGFHEPTTRMVKFTDV
jgi:hypothetical protein